MKFEIAVFAGLVGILLCAMLGGMRAPRAIACVTDAGSM